MKYEATAIRKEMNKQGDWEAIYETSLGTYETEYEAEIAVEKAIDEDLMYGECDNYDYAIKRVTTAAQ